MKLLDGERVEEVLGDFKIITAESAFVVRTFFFIIFGWSVYLGSLFSFKVIGLGLIILTVIYVVRVIILKSPKTSSALSLSNNFNKPPLKNIL